MIRITVELLPLGSERGKVLLGEGRIINDGSGTLHVGNYNVELSMRGNARRLWKEARVTGFPREQLGGWDLLCRALTAAIGRRNPASTVLQPEECGWDVEELTTLESILAAEPELYIGYTGVKDAVREVVERYPSANKVRAVLLEELARQYRAKVCAGCNGIGIRRAVLGSSIVEPGELINCPECGASGDAR